MKKCALVVCNEDKVNPVNFSWQWGKEVLPILDQHTYLGVDILKKLLLGYTHGRSNRTR